jgi:spore germination protein KC
MQGWRTNLLKLFLVILTLFVISGCWSRIELESLAIVAGIGIDLAEEPGKVLLTAQIILPKKVAAPDTGGVGGGGEIGGKGQTVLISKGIGETVYDAINNFAADIPRRLFWSHTQVIVIGKEAAEQGVRPWLDFFIRDPEPREAVWILVADGKAGDILKSKSEIEDIPAMAIAHLIEARISNSQTSGATLGDFTTRLTSKTTAPVATYIKLSDEKEPKVQLSGTAVFKKDKLVGVLDKAQTRGYLWVKGKVRGGIVLVKFPKDNSKTTLEVIRSKSTVTPKILGGEISLKIEIDEEANLESQSSLENLETATGLALLEKQQDSAIRNEILAALEKARQLNTDFFGFGDIVHHKFPREWKKLELRWDQIFPLIKVTIQVKTKIRQVGLVTKPMAPE